MSTAVTLLVTGLIVLAVTVGRSPAAHAAQPAVGLGTATSFAVLAGTTVTNTGPTTVFGDLGVSPGTAVTGFPPGQVIDGDVHAADAVALQAQNDLTTAYNDAAGRTPAVDKTGDDLGGETLVAGVYRSNTTMALTGAVTLDAQGDPSAVFIFQAGSSLLTASGSSVVLINGAQACNVFWQVGSSATIGTSTTFVGTVMALSSITVQTQATIQGRVLARNGQVSLDTNTITRPTCAAPPTSTPPTSTPPTSTPPTSTPPTSTPPTSTPPTSTPPTSTPPTSTPPTSTPPTSTPPTSTPPTSTPPTSTPPTSTPPTSTPPTTTSSPTTTGPTTTGPTTTGPTTTGPTTTGPTTPTSTGGGPGNPDQPGTPTPPGSSNPPWVPEGHPPTGQAPAVPKASDGGLWVGGGMCILGVAFGAAAAWRPRSIRRT